MRKAVFRSLSSFLSVLLLLSVSIPAYAAGEDYSSKSSFFSWVAGSNGIAQKILGHLPVSDMTACPDSKDGQHHSDSYFEDRGNGYYTSVCSYCGKAFTSYASDLSAAYEDYVQELPATGYNSAGGLVWHPTIDDLEPDLSCLKVFHASYASREIRCSNIPYESSSSSGSLADSSLIVGKDMISNTYFVSLAEYPRFDLSFSFFCRVPISGSYRLISTLFCDYSVLTKGGRSYTDTRFFPNVNSFSHFLVGDNCSISCSTPVISDSISYASANIYLPAYEVIPDTAPSGDTYSTTTRPTSIQGGNYGIVGDNNQITKVENNSSIVNETTNTYYNPATGATSPISSWSYDYSDRSYKVSLESGGTSTITYGDENISIQETTVNESGDTITNNYTIYYLVDGSGSDTPVTPPGTCAHSWAETSATPATCTVPGSKLFTCSLCQQAKKEAVPALGHDWQVKQTVTTEYDDTGQLIQEGYTIFECSRCHEQRKSADGTVPPGGGSGTDPGEDGESIWDKLGNLLGSVAGGLIGMVEAVLGKILDALTALTGMLMAKLKTVVETVLQIFDEVPKLFGGFLEFLAAVFPFLPPELMTILTFGVIAVAFIGIIKAVRR